MTYEEESREIMIQQLMDLISDIKNGAVIEKFYLQKNLTSYILEATITPRELPYNRYINKAINEVHHNTMKTQKKKKSKYIDCHTCDYHNYDWYIDDGHNGDEFEICEKGHELYPEKCEDYEEL